MFRSHLGKCRSLRLASLVGLLTLGACVGAESYGPPGKSQARLNIENDICSRMAARFGGDQMAYAQCSLRFGNTVKLPNGEVLEPQYTYPPPRVPYIPRRSPIPEVTPPPPEQWEDGRQPSPPPPDNIAPSVARFANIIEQYQFEIFKAAHPSGKLINGSVRTVQDVGEQATVVDDISWEGTFSGKSYTTTLQFTLRSHGNTLDSASMAVSETNNPFPQAFLGTAISKVAALKYISSRLKDENHRAASFIVNIINDNTSIEDALTSILIYLANG
jgi:hypothetical protein